MYTVLSRSIMKSKYSVANLSKIYKKMSRSPKPEVKKSVSEPVNLATDTQDKTVDFKKEHTSNDLFKIFRKKYNYQEMKRSLFSESPKEVIQIMMFSTSSSKYFYTSTINQEKKSSKTGNTKAVDIYKKALEDAMKIKFEKKRLDKPIEKAIAKTTKPNDKSVIRLTTKESVKMEQRQIRPTVNLSNRNVKSFQVVYPDYELADKTRIRDSVKQTVPPQLKPTKRVQIRAVEKTEEMGTEEKETEEEVEIEEREEGEEQANIEVNRPKFKNLLFRPRSDKPKKISKITQLIKNNAEERRIVGERYSLLMRKHRDNMENARIIKLMQIAENNKREMTTSNKDDGVVKQDKEKVSETSDINQKSTQISEERKAEKQTGGSQQLEEIKDKATESRLLAIPLETVGPEKKENAQLKPDIKKNFVQDIAGYVDKLKELKKQTSVSNSPIQTTKSESSKLSEEFKDAKEKEQNVDMSQETNINTAANTPKHEISLLPETPLKPKRAAESYKNEAAKAVISPYFLKKATNKKALTPIKKNVPPIKNDFQKILSQYKVNNNTTKTNQAKQSNEKRTTISNTSKTKQSVEYENKIKNMIRPAKECINSIKEAGENQIKSIKNQITDNINQLKNNPKEFFKSKLLEQPDQAVNKTDPANSEKKQTEVLAKASDDQPINDEKDTSTLQFSPTQKKPLIAQMKDSLENSIQTDFKETFGDTFKETKTDENKSNFKSESPANLSTERASIVDNKKSESDIKKQLSTENTFAQFVKVNEENQKQNTAKEDLQTNLKERRDEKEKGEKEKTDVSQIDKNAKNSVILTKTAPVMATAKESKEAVNEQNVEITKMENELVNKSEKRMETKEIESLKEDPQNNVKNLPKKSWVLCKENFSKEVVTKTRIPPETAINEKQNSDITKNDSTETSSSQKLFRNMSRITRMIRDEPNIEDTSSKHIDNKTPKADLMKTVGSRENKDKEPIKLTLSLNKQAETTPSFEEDVGTANKKQEMLNDIIKESAQHPKEVAKLLKNEDKTSQHSHVEAKKDFFEGNTPTKQIEEPLKEKSKADKPLDQVRHEGNLLQINEDSSVIGKKQERFEQPHVTPPPGYVPPPKKKEDNKKKVPPVPSPPRKGDIILPPRKISDYRKLDKDESKNTKQTSQEDLFTDLSKEQQPKETVIFDKDTDLKNIITLKDKENLRKNLKSIFAFIEELEIKYKDGSDENLIKQAHEMDEIKFQKDNTINTCSGPIKKPEDTTNSKLLPVIISGQEPELPDYKLPPVVKEISKKYTESNLPTHLVRKIMKYKRRWNKSLKAQSKEYEHFINNMSINQGPIIEKPKLKKNHSESSLMHFYLLDEDLRPEENEINIPKGRVIEKINESLKLFPRISNLEPSLPDLGTKILSKKCQEYQGIFNENLNIKVSDPQVKNKKVVLPEQVTSKTKLLLDNTLEIKEITEKSNICKLLGIPPPVIKKDLPVVNKKEKPNDNNVTNIREPIIKRSMSSKQKISILLVTKGEAVRHKLKARYTKPAPKPPTFRSMKAAESQRIPTKDSKFIMKFLNEKSKRRDSQTSTIQFPNSNVPLAQRSLREIRKLIKNIKVVEPKTEPISSTLNIFHNTDFNRVKNLFVLDKKSSNEIHTSGTEETVKIVKNHPTSLFKSANTGIKKEPVLLNEECKSKNCINAENQHKLNLKDSLPGKLSDSKYLHKYLIKKDLASMKNSELDQILSKAEKIYIKEEYKGNYLDSLDMNHKKEQLFLDPFDNSVKIVFGDSKVKETQRPKSALIERFKQEEHILKKNLKEQLNKITSIKSLTDQVSETVKIMKLSECCESNIQPKLKNPYYSHMQQYQPSVCVQQNNEAVLAVNKVVGNGITQVTEVQEKKPLNIEYFFTVLPGSINRTDTVLSSDKDKEPYLPKMKNEKDKDKDKASKKKECNSNEKKSDKESPNILNAEKSKVKRRRKAPISVTESPNKKKVVTVSYSQKKKPPEKEKEKDQKSKLVYSVSKKQTSKGYAKPTTNIGAKKKQKRRRNIILFLLKDEIKRNEAWHNQLIRQNMSPNDKVDQAVNKYKFKTPTEVSNDFNAIPSADLERNQRNRDKEQLMDKFHKNLNKNLFKSNTVSKTKSNPKNEKGKQTSSNDTDKTDPLKSKSMLGENISPGSYSHSKSYSRKSFDGTKANSNHSKQKVSQTDKTDNYFLPQIPKNLFVALKKHFSKSEHFMSKQNNLGVKSYQKSEPLFTEKKEDPKFLKGEDQHLVSKRNYSRMVAARPKSCPEKESKNEISNFSFYNPKFRKLLSSDESPPKKIGQNNGQVNSKKGKEKEKKEALAGIPAILSVPEIKKIFSECFQKVKKNKLKHDKDQKPYNILSTIIDFINKRSKLNMRKDDKNPSCSRPRRDKHFDDIKKKKLSGENKISKNTKILISPVTIEKNVDRITLIKKPLKKSRSFRHFKKCYVKIPTRSFPEIRLRSEDTTLTKRPSEKILKVPNNLKKKSPLKVIYVKSERSSTSTGEYFLPKSFVTKKGELEMNEHLRSVASRRFEFLKQLKDEFNNFNSNQQINDLKIPTMKSKSSFKKETHAEENSNNSLINETELASFKMDSKPVEYKKKDRSLSTILKNWMKKNEKKQHLDDTERDPKNK